MQFAVTTLIYFRIENMKTSSFFQEMFGHVNRRRFASVTSVLFKCKSQNCNVLIRNGVEHGLNDSLTKARFLVFVHVNHLLPICCNTRQVEGFADVDQIENIFLKATPTPSNGSLNEYVIIRCTVHGALRDIEVLGMNIICTKGHVNQVHYLEEFGAKTGVESDGLGNFTDISTRRFANCRYGIDA